MPISERTLQILLIEDNPGDARLIEEMLKTPKSSLSESEPTNLSINCRR